MTFATSQFNRVLGVLEKSMSVNRLRARVITNNMANADTPGFKRTDINFESQLKRALDNEARGIRRLEMVRTEAQHFSSPEIGSWEKVQPRAVLDYHSSVKNNGNNVDFEKETGDSIKNKLTYDLMVEVMRFQFNQVNMVIR